MKLLLLIALSGLTAGFFRNAVFYHRTCKPWRSTIATAALVFCIALTLGLGIDIVFRGGM